MDVVLEVASIDSTVKMSGHCAQGQPGFNAQLLAPDIHLAVCCHQWRDE
jgi:hypothetical protein